MAKDEYEPVAASEGGAASEKAEVARWQGEIDAARKRENKYRKEAAEIMDLYEGESAKDYSYNILYANVDTLSPALYNATPRPVVKRRFRDDDKLGMIAAKAGQRILEFLIDTGSDEYTDFDELMGTNVHEGILTSRGVSRFKYMASMTKVGEGADAYDKVKSELVCGEAVAWNRMLYGYAKRWSDTPWEAFIHYMSREELVENFGPEIGNRVKLEVSDDTDKDGKDKEEPPRDANVKFAMVYEILDRGSRKVLFMSPGLPEQFLKQDDDPWGVQGFFPNPQPLYFVTKVTDTLPIPLYRMYAQQAKELNSISYRINMLVRALKVRGAYDGSLEGLKKILEAEDNTLEPIDQLAQLAAQGMKSLENAIWLFPIENLIQVVQQLYLARQQCLQVIYEITGLADIMRGSSDAGETLGAQELKNQWGTLRLKKSQKRVQRYVRSCLRIMLEIAVGKISVETAEKMTGMGLMTAAAKQQLQMAVQKAQQMGMAQSVPPEAQAQVQEQLAQPSWEEVLALLRDDLQRNFRIDIETNSTIDAEATEDKQDIAELLNAISQFLNGIAPLIEQGFMPFDAARGMLLTITRRFRLGDEFEEQLAKMKEPPPKQDPKVQAEQQKMQNEQEKHKLDMQAKQADLAMKQQEMQMELQMMRAELQMEREKMDLERQKMGMQMQQQQANNAAQIEMLSAKVAAAHAMPKKPQGQPQSKQGAAA